MVDFLLLKKDKIYNEKLREIILKYARPIFLAVFLLLVSRYFFW